MCCLAAGLATGGTVHADSKLTWFGETVFTGAYPADSFDAATLKALRDHDRPSDLLRTQSLLVENQVGMDRVFRNQEADITGESNTLRGEVGFALGEETFSIPLLHRNSLLSGGRSEELSALGLKWRHQFEGLGRLTVATHFGKGAWAAYNDSSRSDTANTLTSVSWTSDIGDSGSAISGSLYYGNELQQSSTITDPTRRVYGLAVGGQWALGQRHVPYVGLRYQTGDPATGPASLSELEDYTRISAGWNWRVSPNWNVSAEANFTYDQPTWDLFNVNQTRILFSTRFNLH
jgi:hypothetical protein